MLAVSRFCRSERRLSWETSGFPRLIQSWDRWLVVHRGVRSLRQSISLIVARSIHLEDLRRGFSLAKSFQVLVQVPVGTLSNLVLGSILANLKVLPLGGLQTKILRWGEVHHIFNLSWVAAYAKLGWEFTVSRKAHIVFVILLLLVNISKWLWDLLKMWLDGRLFEAGWRLNLPTNGRAWLLGWRWVGKWVCASPESVLTDASKASYFDILLKLTLSFNNILQVIHLHIMRVRSSLLGISSRVMFLRYSSFMIIFSSLLGELVLFKWLESFIRLYTDWTGSWGLV